MQRRQFLRAAGTGAAAVGAAASPAAAQEDGGGNETEGEGDQAGGNETEGDGGGGGGTETVAVGPGGENVFDPADLAVQPGTTVVWEWDSDNHNVVVQNQPDDASWDGQPESETFDTGYSYEYTFEVEGTYDYYCQPHRGAGMTASLEVSQDAGSGGGGGGPPTVPASALNLVIGLIAAIATTLSLAFFFLKYGGSREEA